MGIYLLFSFSRGEKGGLSFYATHTQAILTTMDIVHDGFGFMLVFGDLAWVPFTYTVQARYLVDHPKQLPNYFAATVFLLQTFGYLAFRGANSQKDLFRRDPNSPKVKHVKYINTKRGTKLMVSGKWEGSEIVLAKINWLHSLLRANILFLTSF